MYRQKGFTLAEVLVTLAIIGVVAALTIPSLMNNIQDQQYKSAYKKIYSTVDQATKRIMEDNEGTLLGLCDNQDSNCLKNLYLKYMSTIKSCNKWDAKSEGCWHVDNSAKYLNGTYYNDLNAKSGIVLSNGALILIEWAYKYCDNGSGPCSCAFMSVDINGFKKPNTVGKDIYSIFLFRDKVIPDGAQGTWNNSLLHSTCIDGSTAAINDGWRCSFEKLIN